MRPSSTAKMQLALAAAEDAFLAQGFDAVTMDDIARTSGVAKQTLYAHFSSKEGLFLQLVRNMTGAAGDAVLDEPLVIATAADVAPALTGLLDEQLSVVLTPRLLRLRRLVIGEVRRYPELGRALAENGPHRAIAVLAGVLADLDARHLLRIPDAARAAGQLNWLVMGQPVNDAMMLGDGRVPTPAERRAHVASAVEVFLAAYRV